MGITLTHEHIMSNFGLDINEAASYDENAVFKQIIPYLKNLKTKGVSTIFDCTTAFFGRRVDLLQKISVASKIQIITNTGYYGAANDKYIPEFAYTESVEEISQRWINEFKNGIDGTTIKPGFIKLAFDSGIPSDIDKKLYEAGVLTHKKTGLTLAVHTAKNKEAIEFQLEILKKHHVNFEASIWVHANKEENTTYLLEKASQGLWISLDGVNNSNTKEYINLLKTFKSKNLLHKILLSHDGNSYPRGQDIRPYDAISNLLIPEMIAEGFSEKDINQLLIENPKKAFSISIKIN